MRRLSRQAGTLGVIPYFLGAVGGEEQFAQRGDMQRRPSADQINHAHQGATTGRAFDIDDLVLVTDAEVDGFADLSMQFLHERTRHAADADARLDDIAQLQQTDSQRVSTRLVPLDEPGIGHHRQNAVRRRRMQAGGLGQHLQRGRFVVFSQDIEQGHHSFDDLDRAFGFQLFSHDFGESLVFLGVVRAAHDPASAGRMRHPPCDAAYYTTRAHKGTCSEW